MYIIMCVSLSSSLSLGIVIYIYIECIFFLFIHIRVVHELFPLLGQETKYSWKKQNDQRSIPKLMKVAL